MLNGLRTICSLLIYKNQIAHQIERVSHFLWNENDRSKNVAQKSKHCNIRLRNSFLRKYKDSDFEFKIRSIEVFLIFLLGLIIIT